MGNSVRVKTMSSPLYLSGGGLYCSMVSNKNGSMHGLINLTLAVAEFEIAPFGYAVNLASIVYGFVSSIKVSSSV